ncbi:MAG: fatty acid desaturase [Inquilinus sp.]|nr:fatty acid desaturase [Inquilinus sp.]
MAQLARHGALLAVTGLCVTLAADSLWLLPAMAVHGLALVFLFAPLHETIHRTAFQSRRANAVLAWLCGLVLLIPPTDFRHFHWAHHRHTQDPARDPELATPKPASRPAYLLHLSGLPFWRDRIVALVRQAGGNAARPYLPAAAGPRAVREARLFLVLYAAAATVAFLAGSTAPLVYWAIPVVLGQPALRAFLLAEHTGCPTVADMTRNTRTTLTTRLARLLGWNMSFHTEHHLHPSVPFHALPKLHGLLARRLGCVAPGYRAAHREIRAGFGGAGIPRS